jgi:Arc/MetJ-type ribon-helix-helix transcriptional regulator
MEIMKKSVSVTLDKELTDWIDSQVATQKYRNRSHLVELAVSKFREAEKRQTERE